METVERDAQISKLETFADVLETPAGTIMMGVVLRLGWERAYLARSRVVLAFINDVRTFLSRDDNEVKRIIENIRTLKTRFEGDDFKRAA